MDSFLRDHIMSRKYALLENNRLYFAPEDIKNGQAL